MGRDTIMTTRMTMTKNYDFQSATHQSPAFAGVMLPMLLFHCLRLGSRRWRPGFFFGRGGGVLSTLVVELLGGGGGGVRKQDTAAVGIPARSGHRCVTSPDHALVLAR